MIAEARRNGVHLGFALAAPDKSGVLRFIPFEAQACSDLETYCDTVDWSQLRIIVLPYIAAAADLVDTVEVLRAEGASVFSPTPGDGYWPEIVASGRYGGQFNNAVFEAIVQQLQWQGQALPRERFERSAARYPDYLVMPGALDLCDTVAPSRLRFLNKSSEALELICRRRGDLGKTLFHFFEERGIDLAPTGGITTILRLKNGARQIGAALRSEMHLKEGDATTPQAAARIYFQLIDRDNKFRLALFYVGPHPDNDIDRSIEWQVE